MQAERPFKALIERTQDCIKIFEKGRLTYFNPAANTIHHKNVRLGMSVKEWLYTIAPEQRAEARKAYQKAERGQPARIIVKHTPGTSNCTYCALHVFPIKEDHKIAGIMSVSRDITHEKKKEHELLVYKEMIEKSPVGILLTDPDGKISYVNKEFEHVTKWTLAECKGKTPRILKSGKYSKIFYKKLWNIIKKQKKTFRGTLLNKRKTGELYWDLHQITPILDKNGKILHFVGFETDVTELKKLEDQYEILARIPEENPSPIWRMARNGTLLYRNTSAKKLGTLPPTIVKKILTACTTKQTCGFPYKRHKKEYRLDVVHVKNRPYANIFGVDVTEATRAREQLQKSKEDVEKEVERRTRELENKINDLELFKDSVVSAELKLAKLEQENQSLKQMTAQASKETTAMRAGTDAKDTKPRATQECNKKLPASGPAHNGLTHNAKTAQEKSEQTHLALTHMLRRLKESYQKLQTLDKLKDEFLQSTSHELRTPLTSLKGFVELMKQEELGKTSKKQRDALAAIEYDVNRLTNSITKILDTARIEAGITFERKKIDFNALVKDVAQPMIVAARTKKIAFILDLKPLPIVHADRQWISQVVTNFVHNAVKYTNQGRITVKTEKTGNNLTFSVTDTGIGIKKEHIPLLFTKFFQVTHTTSGSGLGLYIGKKIIEQHKGQINVESTQGKGSTFSFTIPLKPHNGTVQTKKLNAGMQILHSERKP